MELPKESALLVTELLLHVAKAISPLVVHQGTPTGDILAAVAQNAFAKSLDIAIAALARPPQEAFKILSKWGVCVVTDQNGVDGTIAEVVNGNNNPRPCTVIYKHGQYNLVHCRRGTNGSGIFCLVNTTTDEGIAEDIMPKLVADLIEDLPSTPTY